MRNIVDVIEETQKTEQHLLLFSEYAFNGLSALINTVKSHLPQVKNRAYEYAI